MPMMKLKPAIRTGVITLTVVIILILFIHFPNISSTVNESSFRSIEDGDTTGTSDFSSIVDTPMRRLPNAIIAGCAKCGTRSLLWLLSLHPDIKEAGPEIHFFDRDENYQKGIDWYKEHFPPRLENQIGIEKSPSYFVVDNVPKRIHDMNSSMKIIVIVCEPVKRTVSSFTQVSGHSATGSDRNFKKFVYGANMETESIDPSRWGVRNGMYLIHLKNWLKWFPLDQILFLDGDRFKVDPLSELNKVEEFLNIPHFIDEKLLVFNKTKGFYCVVRGDDVKCLGDGKGRPHLDTDPVVKQKLADFYAPLNEEFLNSIGKHYNWDVWN